MSNLLLLIIWDYYYSHNKRMKGKMETGQGYGMGIGGCDELCPMATELSLVTLFSLSVSIKDRPLLSQNRPIYKNTSTMAIRKRSHCHT